MFHKPIELIQVILGLSLLTQGVYVASPFSTENDAPALHSLGPPLTTAIAIAMAIIGGLWILVVVRKKATRSQQRMMTYIAFYVFAFLALLKVIATGPGQIVWVNLLAEALITGGIYLYLSGDTDAGT